jgi:hypothetical protein
MIRERQRNNLAGGPVTLCTGDQLICRVTDKDGRTETFREDIGRSQIVDTVVTFDVEGEFGLKDGIGAVFGKQA